MSDFAPEEPNGPSPIAVSACLIGCHCRYDDLDRFDQSVRNALANAPFVPVCPEVLAGMGVPRPPISFCTVAGETRVVSDSGIDVTSQLEEAVKAIVDFLVGLGCSTAVCKERSPSCGVDTVTVDGRLVAGSGVLTTRMRAAGIRVVSDEDVARDGISVPGQ